MPVPFTVSHLIVTLSLAFKDKNMFAAIKDEAGVVAFSREAIVAQLDELATFTPLTANQIATRL